MTSDLNPTAKFSVDKWGFLDLVYEKNDEGKKEEE